LAAGGGSAVHKVALHDIAPGDPVLRYGTPIAFAARAIPGGAWVREELLTIPPAPELDELPLATAVPPPQPPLEGFTFEGYPNSDGTVGTRNILALTTTVQCVAPTVEFAAERIRRELLPRYPGVADVVALVHSYGCGVAIDAPGADVPIRTLRNLALNPNLGGETSSSASAAKAAARQALPFGETRQAAKTLVCGRKAPRLHRDGRVDRRGGREEARRPRPPPTCGLPCFRPRRRSAVRRQ
jgi:galactarate dehydratase